MALNRSLHEWAGISLAGRARGALDDHRLLWIRMALVLGVVIVRLPTLSEPRWFSDEGIFTAVAQGVSGGLPLYAKVFDNSPPGIYMLFLALISLGAVQHHWLVGAASSAAVASVALLMFSLVRRLASTTTAALAAATCGIALSIPTLDGDLINVELAALPFFMASLLVAFSKRPWAPYASGLLLGLAILIRPSFVVDSVALLVPLVLIGSTPIRRVGLAAAGLASVLVAMGSFLLVDGSLGAYVGTVMPSNHAYVVWSNAGSLTPLYLRLLALAGVAAVWFRMSRTIQGRLMAIWIPAALAGATITPREYMHYAQEAIPALAVGAAFMVARFRPRWQLAWAPVALVGVVLAAQLALLTSARETAILRSRAAPPLQYNFTFAQLPDYYRNWLLFVGGRENWTAYTATFPTDIRQREAEIALLRRLSAKTEQPNLLVLGDEPWLYVGSGLPPATRYVAINSASAMVPSAPFETRTAVASACATFVVVIGNEKAQAAVLQSAGYREVRGAPWPTFTDSEITQPVETADIGPSTECGRPGE
jgi:hypothetical protein